MRCDTPCVLGARSGVTGRRKASAAIQRVLSTQVRSTAPGHLLPLHILIATSAQRSHAGLRSEEKRRPHRRALSEGDAAKPSQLARRAACKPFADADRRLTSETRQGSKAREAWRERPGQTSGEASAWEPRDGTLERERREGRRAWTRQSSCCERHSATSHTGIAPSLHGAELDRRAKSSHEPHRVFTRAAPQQSPGSSRGASG